MRFYYALRFKQFFVALAMIIVIGFFSYSSAEAEALPTIKINLHFQWGGIYYSGILEIVDSNGDGSYNYWYFHNFSGMDSNGYFSIQSNGGSTQHEPFTSGDATGYELRDHSYSTSTCPGGSNHEQSWNMYDPKNQMIGTLSLACPDQMIYEPAAAVSPKINLSENSASKTASINVFPNPTNSYINIEFKNLISGFTYNLYDQNGDIYLSGEYNENQLASISNLQLDVSHLSKGVFFLKISYENGTNVTQKVIIVK